LINHRAHYHLFNEGDTTAGHAGYDEENGDENNKAQ
jgi:hypothetical protein